MTKDQPTPEQPKDGPTNGIWPVKFGVTDPAAAALDPQPTVEEMTFEGNPGDTNAPWSDPGHDVVGDIRAGLNGAIFGPPAPRVPKAAWELPGHPVYDLARRIFMIDNSNAPDARKEWDDAPAAYRDYAFNIAQGLIKAGWEKKDMARDAAVLEVVAAWSDPGPVPEFHRIAQRDLLLGWQTLGGALMRLAGLRRGPVIDPPPPVKP